MRWIVVEQPTIPERRFCEGQVEGKDYPGQINGQISIQAKAGLVDFSVLFCRLNSNRGFLLTGSGAGGRRRHVKVVREQRGCLKTAGMGTF